MTTKEVDIEVEKTVTETEEIVICDNCDLRIDDDSGMSARDACGDIQLHFCDACIKEFDSDWKSDAERKLEQWWKYDFRNEMMFGYDAPAKMFPKVIRHSFLLTILSIMTMGCWLVSLTGQVNADIVIGLLFIAMFLYSSNLCMELSNLRDNFENKLTDNDT